MYKKCIKKFKNTEKRIKTAKRIKKGNNIGEWGEFFK